MRFDKAEMLDRSSYGAATLEELSFASSTGDTIPAKFLRQPTTGPAILYCHAHGAAYHIGKSELTEGRPALAGPYLPDLAAAGYSVLCIEMPCFGARAEPAEAPLSKAYHWHGRTLFGRMLAEQVAGFEFLLDQPQTDPDRVADASELLIIPDHYVLRMLVSQGISLDDLGVGRTDGTIGEPDRRAIWRRFAEHYHLFRATPSRLWLDQVFQDLFGLTERPNAANADNTFDAINAALATEAFRPRSLFDRFNIEILATTESALDPLNHHAAIRASDWNGRVITTYRPDAVIDPEFEGFSGNIEALASLTGLPATTWHGYLEAHRDRRAFFRENGATATDHGHSSARTEVLDNVTAATLFDKALTGRITAEESDAFRGHMLTEMARMSVEDGMVMQLHAGSVRNHSASIFNAFGRDKGFDIPMRTDYVGALKPLLDELGHSNLSLILFTLDEITMSRELAPLAGAYPALKLGPAWWFFDSAEGMRRYREITTETAGFYNTVGFNDDTRALCSIPARHDVSRRVDAAYLSDLVTTGRLDEAEAHEVAADLAYNLAKKAYRL